MTEIGDRIDRLCILLGEDGTYLRDAAERAGAAETLSRILTAIRAPDGQPGPAQLLHDLDALDQAMARTGHGYVTRPNRVYKPLRGEPPPPAVDVWVCPAPHACARLVRARDADHDTACAIIGQVLKRVRFTP